MTTIVMIYTLAILLILGVVVYAVLDGFDLGIGNSFYVFKKEDRGRLLDTIAPLWDGNETWLIYVGTIGVAAFPILYYGILPSLYIPAILMVAGLFIRGLSFEFRLKAQGKDKAIWDFTFFLGSFLASFFQGVLFSCAFVGLDIVDGVYRGGALDFINPFSFTAGLLTVIVYSILGLSFIRYKMEGEVAEIATKKIKQLILFSFAGTFFMEYWLLTKQLGLKEHFFSESYKLTSYILLSVLSVLILTYLLKVLNNPKHNVKTFLTTMSLFVISLLKKVIIVWPYVIFPNYTLVSAANSHKALEFTFIVICIFLPIVICATIFTYSTFRGKLKTSDQFYS